MNKIKIYLRSKGDISEQASVYSNIFLGKVLKTSFEENNSQKRVVFAYLELATDVNILIARHRDSMPSHGYNSDVVLSLKSKEAFLTIWNNLKKSPDFKCDFVPKHYSWGTTITKFYDRWGYGWILETSFIVNV